MLWLSTLVSPKKKMQIPKELNGKPGGRLGTTCISSFTGFYFWIDSIKDLGIQEQCFLLYLKKWKVISKLVLGPLHKVWCFKFLLQYGVIKKFLLQYNIIKEIKISLQIEYFLSSVPQVILYSGFYKHPN